MLVGMTLSSYDEWHGDSKHFVIGHVVKQKDSFLIAEKKDSPWNKISMTDEEMMHLIDNSAHLVPAVALEMVPAKA